MYFLSFKSVWNSTHHVARIQLIYSKAETLSKFLSKATDELKIIANFFLKS